MYRLQADMELAPWVVGQADESMTDYSPPEESLVLASIMAPDPSSPSTNPKSSSLCCASSLQTQRTLNPNSYQDEATLSTDCVFQVRYGERRTVG